MSADMEDTLLPPISFACRGFVRKDGSVFGWTLFQGDHAAYHRVHGTSDKDFATRWRLWSDREPVDFERHVEPAWRENVQAWLDEHGDEVIRFADAEKP